MAGGEPPWRSTDEMKRDGFLNALGRARPAKEEVGRAEGEIRTMKFHRTIAEVGALLTGLSVLSSRISEGFHN